MWGKGERAHPPPRTPLVQTAWPLIICSKDKFQKTDHFSTLETTSLVRIAGPWGLAQTWARGLPTEANSTATAHTPSSAATTNGAADIVTADAQELCVRLGPFLFVYEDGHL